MSIATSPVPRQAAEDPDAPALAHQVDRPGDRRGRGGRRDHHVGAEAVREVQDLILQILPAGVDGQLSAEVAFRHLYPRRRGVDGNHPRTAGPQELEVQDAHGPAARMTTVSPEAIASSSWLAKTEDRGSESAA